MGGNWSLRRSRGWSLRWCRTVRYKGGVWTFHFPMDFQKGNKVEEFEKGREKGHLIITTTKSWI